MKNIQKLACASQPLSCYAAAAPAAFADKKSEAYVQANANSVLQVLNDKSLDQKARETKFGEYMNKFAHMPTIAKRVLGVNARTLSQSDFDKYYKTFEHYAMEVYQVHFDPSLARLHQCAVGRYGRPQEGRPWFCFRQKRLVHGAGIIGN
jgi:ABC-type transporter MlaC component